MKILHFVLISFVSTASVIAQADDEPTANAFRAEVQPLLKQFCFECHSGDRTEAEVDLGAFADLSDLRGDLKIWLRVRGMLNTRQMPPKDARQPSDDEIALMQKWVDGFLKKEAKANAGDPGPVVLRRLNNDEYNYVIRDLTGLPSLDLTNEFPVDGAAGEGFINTGSGQGMSPALLQKYLDAAKRLTRHAVLTPDGIQFSRHTTRADHTSELMARIQRFYRQFTADGGGTAVNLHGIQFNTNQGGVLPVEKYLEATVAHRDALLAGKISIKDVAKKQALNERYLSTLWHTFRRETSRDGLAMMDLLRERWRDAKPGNTAALVAEVKAIQASLWKFNSIGHIGRDGGPKSWLEHVSNVTTRQELRQPLSESTNDVTVFLTANGLDDKESSIVLQQPRIEFKPEKDKPAHPPILLRDIRKVAGQIEQSIASQTARTKDYLAAVKHWQSSKESLAKVAKNKGLDAHLLERWSALTDIGQRVNREVTGHDLNKVITLNGKKDINGWGVAQTPMTLTNRSDKPVEIGTPIIPARGVTVHPSPTIDSVIAWKSPVDGEFEIHGFVADADSKCGNGVDWRVGLLSEFGLVVLYRGAMDNAGKTEFGSDDKVSIKAGDIVSIVVGPRDRSHVCDTTHVSITFRHNKQKWDLANDVVDNILDSNPLPDSYGNPSTWHFCTTANKGTKPISRIPPGSALAKWRRAVVDKNPTEELANSVQNVLLAKSDKDLGEPDKQLRRQLLDWRGPLEWTTVARDSTTENSNSTYGLAADLFSGADLEMKSSRSLEFRLPAALVASGEFVVAGVLDSSAQDGVVQLGVQLAKPSATSLSPGKPILVGEKSQAQIKAQLQQLAELFPPALCYARIVPVDEVVTLTLYHREDDHLKRLMLDEGQAKELDRLWDELFYVGREPLKLVVALEQIYEFATQDRPDLVKAFEPMKKKVSDRAERFRERMLRIEPMHVDAVLKLADRAWRRPLTSAEQQSLRGLYQSLRDAEISHEEAVRLTLARVLTSPAFLYKLENPGDGKIATRVTSRELATRLSFFLWSSLPDEQLRHIADGDGLASDEQVLAQTRRMLDDDRIRRLAIQFACQWLHLRNFDTNDDKNEKLYPEFVNLRRDMYEETVRFFENLFRNNGSVLDVLDADYTFLNGTLAKHYGVEGTGDRWQRVDGVRGRGGLLGMASLLSSQSGASRTSPILRGNWVYETLLGQRLPRPPANVPQIPDKVPTGLTTRQLIEKHSSVAACAKCHAHIDPYGFALEQYDAIGRLRPNKVDTKTRLPDGQTIEGIEGLRRYLVDQRRDDFVRNFCTKLLGFSLGRELQLSDEPLVDTMVERLKANEYRFHVAVETIVLSDQFRKIRGRKWGVETK